MLVTGNSGDGISRDCLVGLCMWKIGGKRGKTTVRRAQAAQPAVGVAEWVRGKLGLEPDAPQARVLESRAKRGVLNCTRQWGKSTITAALAVYEAVHRPGSLTLVVSPSGRQSGEFLKKAEGFVARLGIPVRGDGANEMSLRLPNASRIVGLPGSEATIRGFSAVALLLVDEAARVSDELYLAVRPMLAVSRGRLWLMSTPYGKRGFYWQAWERGGDAWERVRVPATECPRIDADFLEEEREAMGERWFRQEYLCEFVAAADSLFDRDLVETAITEEVEPLRLR
jgi:hypothetical protein